MADDDPLPWEGLSPERSRPLKRAGIVVDARRCIGCHACGVACKTEHDVALGAFRIRTHYLQRPDRPAHLFVPMMCQHCQDAPCLEACPTGSIQRRKDGRVVVNPSTCTTSKECLDACPYGAIAIDPHTEKADKCDLCEGRTGVGLEPACVEVCPSGALRYGDLDAADDPAAVYAKEHAARPLRAEHRTRPTVSYVGLERWIEDAAKTVQLHPDDNDIVYERKGR